MVTICAISDSHLGYRHRMKLQRLNDYRDAFLDAVKKAEENNPDLIIFLGDLFHYSKPDPYTMKITFRELKRLAKKMPIVMCIGNHEIEGHLGSSYTLLFSDIHDNIHVLTHENPHVMLNISGKNLAIHGFQFMRRRDMVEEKLMGISRDLDNNNRGNYDNYDIDYNILCLHQGVEKYLEPYEISLKCLRSVAEKYDLILFGHVHKHQRIKEICDITPAFYVGSTERISFNEAENDNGFLVFKDFDFENPVFINVNSASMKRIREDVGVMSPEGVNSYIENIIKKNIGRVNCLQINIDVELDGEYLNIRHDWNSEYTDFTILDVNINPKSMWGMPEIHKKMVISENLIEDYFDRIGMGKRKDLKKVCIDLYWRYGG